MASYLPSPSTERNTKGIFRTGEPIPLQYDRFQISPRSMGPQTPPQTVAWVPLMPHWSSTRCLAANSPGAGRQRASVIGLTIPVRFQFLLRVVCTFLIILLAPLGPLLTYLASCGSTTCDQFDARTAKWFKIDQVGKDNNGAWVQQQISEFPPSSFRVHLVSRLHTVDGNVYSANLPKNLAPGEYLVRHEIIALHLATQKGGAEFYPSCQQIKVGGSGTGVPTQDELLTFPGAYSDDDPGIYTPNVGLPRESVDLPSDICGISRSSTLTPTTSSPVDPSPNLSRPPAVATTTVRAQAFYHRALASRARP